MKIHHIGYLVKSIDEFEKHLIHSGKVLSVEDELQRATLALYYTPECDPKKGPFIELIEPWDESSFTYSQREKFPNRVNHLCYTLKNDTELQSIISKYKLVLFKGPLSAPLFNNSQVYFCINRDSQIIEFLIDPTLT